MHKTFGSEIQMIFVLLLTIAGLVALSLVLGGGAQLGIAAAQGLATPPPVSIHEVTLESFGLPPDTVLAQGSSFDVGVSVNPTSMTKTNGESVMFTFSVTNHGPTDPATFVKFQNVLPDIIEDAAYEFSATDVISDGQPTNPVWLIPGPINVNESVVVTVTGTINTDCDDTDTSTATVAPFFEPADTVSGNDSDEMTLATTGQGECVFYMYFPLIRLDPTPTPLPIQLAYSEDFNSDNPWPEFDSDGCETDNNGSQYWVDLENDRTCLPPAQDEDKPESPYRTYGEFEVEAYHSEGISDAAYGIFINGEGGDDYYVFRIWPNNGCSNGGDWQLLRRKDGDTDTVREGSCNIAINRGGATNKLRIAHRDRTLKMYANDVLLGEFTDNAGDHRTGEGVGLYIRSNDKDIRIKFDNFKVYKYQ